MFKLLGAQMTLTFNFRCKCYLNLLSRRGWAAFEINGVETHPSFRTLPTVQAQPRNRYPLCMCQNAHCNVLVSTLITNFQIGPSVGAHSLILLM